MSGKLTLEDFDFSNLHEYPNVGILRDGTVVENSFKGNGLLRPYNVQFPYTQEALDEIKKCREDKFYFFENYCKIQTLDEGVQLVELTRLDARRRVHSLLRHEIATMSDFGADNLGKL